VPLLSTLETLYHCYLLSHDHLLLYSILYYPALQHLKLILRNDDPLFSFLLISAVAGQVPELLTASTQLPFPSFKFCP